MRKTSIICTLGPSCRTLAVLEEMARAGMDVARVNCSHGTRAQNLFLLDLVDKLNRGRKRRIRKLVDLQGYRVRVRLSGRKKERLVRQDEEVLLSAGEDAGRTDALVLDYPGSLGRVPVGSFVCIDDGNVALRVEGLRKGVLTARAVVPGVIKDGKGVNMPEADLTFGGLTERDRADLGSDLAPRADLVAQSFVRDSRDMSLLRDFLEGRGLRPELVAKIESRHGVWNLAGILGASDGIMVARGDLGVSVPIYQVPVLQKRMIARCRVAGRFVITATQMLESMTEHSRPTRAEVSDVANAVIDGSDYVMLSGETAVGRHPVEAVRMMREITRYTEAYLRSAPGSGKERRGLRGCRRNR